MVIINQEVSDDTITYSIECYAGSSGFSIDEQHKFFKKLALAKKVFVDFIKEPPSEESTKPVTVYLVIKSDSGLELPMIEKQNFQDVVEHIEQKYDYFDPDVAPTKD